MTHENVKVVDVTYNRNGLTKIHFVATYPSYRRRGIIVYNTISDLFCSHTNEIRLLADVCDALLDYRQGAAQ